MLAQKLSMARVPSFFFLLASCLVLVGAADGGQVPQSTALAASAYAYNPVADAYVLSSSPTTNFGLSNQLMVDASPIARSYLRFNVLGMTGTVAKATLRIYATSSQSTGFTVYRINNNTWVETAINYQNAPLFSSVVGTSGPVSANTWISVDVTSFINGNGTFSLALATSNPTALAFGSRHSATKPLLFIQMVASAGSTPTPTATPTRTRTRMPTQAPTRTPTPSSSDPTIVAAGDIACDPTDTNFNGGKGTSSECRQMYTSDVILDINPDAVLDLGDNQYYCGGFSAFLQSYDLSWGRVKGITHPAVGNHEYLTSGGTGCDATNAGAAGYFKYFGNAAGSPSQGYYSYDVGTWHLIALNSNCSSAGGCSSGSPQGTWLQADLVAHPNKCTLAYWHIPLWSSGGRASPNMAPITQILYDNNADLVLTGHDHDYERFAPQNPQGQLDTSRGIRAFVVGTGGANHTSFTTLFPNSEVRNDTTFGVLKLTLHPTGYDWKFVPEAGKTFTDSGTQACH